MKYHPNPPYRKFLYGYEVPDEVHEWYDWLDEEERFDHWMKIGDDYCHLSDFVRANHPWWGNQTFAADGWDAFRADTFFSATVIKVREDDIGEQEYLSALAL